MIYAKHPELGNAYFPDAKRLEIEAAGWVVWPRTKEQKAARPDQSAAPQATPEVVSSPRSTPEPAALPPAKKTFKK